MNAELYNERPFFAIIGDIVDSRKIQDRKLVQQNMTLVLSEINKKFAQSISSRFVITLGDEFQGLLENGDHVVEVIDSIEREMHPIKLRFGIGVGRITTSIDYHMPIGADGPAYYNARKVIEHIKMSRKKKMEIRTNIGIEIENNSCISELINSIFSLSTVIKSTWTDRQREVIKAYIKCSRSQIGAASLIGVNQSTIQKVLKASDYYEYQQAYRSIANVLSYVGESCDV